MPRRRGRGLSPRATGLLLATAFALIAAGVVLLVMMNHSGGGGAGEGGGARPIEVGRTPDPGGAGGGGGGAPAPNEQGGAAVLQWLDKSDQSRVASQLEFAELNPLPRGWYDVVEPRGWLFLDDGRIVHIKAKRGHVRMATRAREPETGEFTGGVLIRVFQPETKGAAIDPETERPVAQMYAPTLSFDSAEGKVETDDRVRASTADFAFEGTGLVLVYNEVQGRIELLETQRDGLIRYSPPADGDGPSNTVTRPPAATPPKPRQPAPSARTGATPAPAPPRIELYRAHFKGDVAVAQRERLIRADSLTGWARMIGGKLAPGAIGEIGVSDDGRRARSGAGRAEPRADSTADGVAAGGGAAAAPPSAVAAPAPAARAEAEQPAAYSSPPMLTRASDDDVAVSWTGPLRLVPVASADELAADSVYLRFERGEDAPVFLHDASAGRDGAEGTCDRLDYAATRRVVSLATGAGGEDGEVVRLGEKDGMSAAAPLISLDLATGIAHLAGAGWADGGNQGRIDWRDDADLTFLMDEGRIIAALREANFAGDVKATSGGASLDGETVRAAFLPTADNSGSWLEKLVVVGNAKGTDENGNWVGGDRFDVHFEPGPSAREPDPTMLVVQGNFKGWYRGSELTADFLESGLRRTAKRDVEATDVTARGNVVYDGADGVHASADEMHAHVPTQHTDLIGREVVLSRGPTRVFGTQVSADGARRELFVYGAGHFEHDVYDEQTGEKTGFVNAKWTRSMEFNDLEGAVDCVGEAHAVAEPTRLERDELHAERVLLWLTPGGKGESAASTGGVSLGIDGDRKLLRARAIGAAIEGGLAEVFGSRANARVESQRFVEASDDPDGRTRARLVYLEGPEIDASNVEGTVGVEGPGRALVEDRRARRRDSGGSGRGGDGRIPGMESGLPGVTLFNWARSMNLDKAERTMNMDGRVRVLHRSLDGKSFLELECQSLSARVLGGEREGELGGLESASARGAVYASGGPTGDPAKRRQIVADELIYDAATDTVIATAEPGNRVTIVDAQGVPVSAAKLSWRLSDDRIEVLRPSAVTAPR